MWAGSGVEARPRAELFDESVVRDFYLRFDAPDWEAQLQANQAADRDMLAHLTVDGTAYDIGIRYKGYSSQRVNSRKKPFNITMDAFVPRQTLMGYDSLNLNNGFADPSMVREILTYRVLRDYMPVPKAAFVRLHIDGQYFGLYLLVQQIERTYLSEWFWSNDGNLFKGDPPDASGGVLGRSALTWLGEDLAEYRRSYELKTQEAGEAAYTQLREMIRVLNLTPDSEFADAVSSVLDVDEALWYLAAHNLFANFDSYYSGHNYFIYQAEEDGLFHMLSWDLNHSLGGFPGRGQGVPGDPVSLATSDPFLLADNPGRPLIRRLLNVPRFRADYLAHYRTLLNGAFAPQRLEALVSQYQALVRDSVRSEPFGLYGIEAFDRNAWEDVTIEGGGGGQPGQPRPVRVVPGVLSLANNRFRFLSGHLDLKSPDHVLVTHTRLPEQPTSDDEVTVEAVFAGADDSAGVDILYRVNGSVWADVQMSRLDGAWQARIPRQAAGDTVSYVLRASLGDGRAAFHPAANRTQAWSYVVSGVSLPVQPGGDLVINELLADNESVGPDPNGEFDDWVELFNRGSQPIRLEGYYLSDRQDEPYAYALPDVTLGPGEYFLVWCDNDPEQGSDHADFRLAAEGESLFLSTSTHTVGNVTFGAQQPDRSYGRLVDAADEWGECPTPTPRQPNACAQAAEQHVFVPYAARQ
jgi:hypothetical protein